MGKKLEGFTEIKQDVFKFENKGDFIQGKLLSKKESDEFGNLDYRIQTKDGTTHKIYGSVILDSKMSDISIGSIVNIEFIGVQESKKEDHQPTKLFRVYWKKDE